MRYGRMKIALLHAYDTHDRRSWSGTVYYVARTLEKYCGEVFHLGPIPRFREMLVGKVINKISQTLFRKTSRPVFRCDRCPNGRHRDSLFRDKYPDCARRRCNVWIAV